MQLDIFATRVAPLARASDVMTSHAAAASVKKDTLSRSQREVLALLKQRSFMAWQLEHELAHLPISPSRVRSAPRELERKGLVEVVGEGQSQFGRPAQIWRAV